MDFTGERLVPGQVDADLWAEHLSRYLFALPLATGRRVLDLGTGAGYGAQRLAAVARSVTAVDLSHEAVSYARAHHGAPAIAHLAADATRLPFADDSFDLVVCFEVIEHLAAQRELLLEVRRVLAKDGVLVVSTPNKRYYTDERHEQNEFHVREFEVPEFRDFLREWFPSVELYVQNHAPAMVISRPGAEAEAARATPTASGRAEAVDEALVTSHYAVAVCGAGPVGADGFVLLSEGAGNVLREREKHVHALEEGHRALLADLQRAQAEFARVEGEWRERTAWARSLEAELGDTREAWRAARAEADGERAARQRAEAEVARAQAELARGIRGAAVRAAKRAARPFLPFAAAAAAVPLAGGLAAGAAAAEGIARLLPARPRLPTLAPPDPTLATILILNYEGKDLLARNLPHLRAAVARTGRPHQILVVDNGSTDGSAAFVRETFPDVDVVELSRNWFFSAGNDLGIPHARHDVVVLLNNDMRVEPDFLEPLLRPFAGASDVFAVASQILMAGKRAEETGLTRGRFSGGLLQLRHDPVPDRPPAAPVPILWAGGGAAAFDKRKFVEIGGLDLLYDPFYCEDLDLSLRAWAHGWRVLFEPASRVWHEHRTTSRRVFGEEFVNETLRRNVLLLHWALLKDPDLMAAHLATLPAQAFAQVRRHGFSGVRSLARAAARAPRALARRLRDRGDGPSLREVVERTDAGASPIPTPRPARGRDEPLRITMLAPYHLYPTDHGGAVRMYHVVRELARRGNRVALVGFVDTEAQRDAARHLEEFCEEVTLLLRGPSDGAPGLLKPPEVREFELTAMTRTLGEHLARFDPDVLQVEYTHMAPYARLAPDRVRCLTEHDVAFVSAYRHAAAERGVSAALAYQRYLWTFQHELRALRDFDVVFTMSERDAALLRGYDGGTTRITGSVPIGVDVDGLARVRRRPDADRIVFLGNFVHRPNVDAVTWFAREILPAIHRRAPEARLVIAGPHAPAEIRRLAEDPRIEVPGFVPDVASVYERAAVIVSPIRIGSGVRVKLLEAFAVQVPVVSTTAGAEGIDVADGRELLLADAPEAFAEATVRLLRDPGLGRTLAARARRLAEERYSCAAVAATLEDEYRAALARRELGRVRT